MDIEVLLKCPECHNESNHSHPLGQAEMVPQWSGVCLGCTNYPQLDALVWVQIQYHQSLLYHSRWWILTHSHHPLRFWLPPSTEKSKRAQELWVIFFCQVWLLQRMFVKISRLLLQLFHSLSMLRVYDKTTCWPAGTRCNGWCGSGDQKVVIFTTRALHQELTLV